MAAERTERDRFRRIEELFRAAAALPDEQREPYLAQQCADDSTVRAQVLDMLRCDMREAGVLESPAFGEGVSPSRVTVDSVATSASRPLPERIGHYRMIRVLGEGGMGIVYEAEQENPRRRVAIKVLRNQRATPQILRRFEQEAQILGRLQHPGIAQILEAGTTEANLAHEAQPFIAMEYVTGKPLLEHTAGRRLGRRERLELMALICDAVHYAHQGGVVHRDLKPGNILVADDTPKILDFGVARLTDADVQSLTLHTTVGELIGTVPYMSPEQAAGDPANLDWRSDVYSLGVILYELLTGRLPQDVRNLMIHEAVRVIREDEPTRASSIDRSLRGDVDTILAKALEKDKARRYQSAADLAADIRRHLHVEPISARPASAMYRLTKFAKRNKAIVAGVAVAFVAMMAATAFSTRQAIVAERARQQEQALRIVADVRTEDAERARQESEAASVFLAEMLGAADPDVMGRDVRVIDVLAHAAAQIDERFADRPAVRAHLRRNIGMTYRQLGMLDEAEVQLAAAVEAARHVYSEDHPIYLRTLRSLAVLYDDQQRFEESLPMHRQMLAIQQRTLGERHRDTLGTACNIGLTLYDLARYDDAAEILEPTVAAMRDEFGTSDRFTLNAVQGLGTVRLKQGRLDEAQALIEEVLEAADHRFGPNDARVISALHNLSLIELARQRPEGALARLDDALERARSVFPENHWRLANILHSKGEALWLMGRLDESEDSLRGALSIYTSAYGPEDAATLASSALLAKIRETRGGN